MHHTPHQSNENLSWANLAGISALGLGLLSTGCAVAEKPLEAKLISPPQTALAFQTFPDNTKQVEIHSIEVRDFPAGISQFISTHPHLRITDIEGDRINGRNSNYTILSRPVRPGEPEQRADIIKTADLLVAANQFRTQNPDREISVMTGDGNHSWGGNGYYVVVSQPLNTPEPVQR